MWALGSLCFGPESSIDCLFLLSYFSNKVIAPFVIYWLFQTFYPPDNVIPCLSNGNGSDK